MNISLAKSTIIPGIEIHIPGSKSESNRLLILNALFPSISIGNLSDSDDTRLLQKALSSKDTTIDIGHAGTAMRFLTAYFAIQDGKEITITGSDRMKQRPIGILVDALRSLGAEISYLENDGFPPLLIKGRKLTANSIALPADVSSQFISALMMIAPKLENGLRIIPKGFVTSAPYIGMTLSLLRRIGIDATGENGTIVIMPARAINEITIQVESDWSSASYFYSAIALSGMGTTLTLRNFRNDSFQGDSELATIYSMLGVETKFGDDAIVLEKSAATLSKIELNLNNTPDLAQTIAVTCFGLGLSCRLTGLRTLKIKETDRLAALQNELRKMGASIDIDDDSLTMQPSAFPDHATIQTYDDHRMAMAFAPLALRFPLNVIDSDVVSKSYPRFWADFNRIGIKMS